MEPWIVRYSDKPELWEDRGDLFDDVWPEYNLHGDVLSHYWRPLFEVFPEWQFMLVDPEDQTLLAEAHTVPVAWDGTDSGLGPTAVSALSAAVPPRYRGRGLAPVLLRAMTTLTREAGFREPLRALDPGRRDAV